jgi:hypothetical protein
VNSEVTNELLGILDHTMRQLDSWLAIMEEDTHFAPPATIMEMLYNRLMKSNTIISSLDRALSLESLSESSPRERSMDES